MGKQNEKLLKNMDTYEQQKPKQGENAIHTGKDKVRQKPVKGK